MATGSEALVDSLDVGFDVRYALLSPNGRYLAVHVYGFDTETNSDGIYLVGLDGATAGRLLAAARGFGSIIGGMGWSPDGERLAFSAPPNFQFAAGAFSDQLVMAATGQSHSLTGGIANDLFIADVTELSLTRLTDSPRDETHPAWSPDGQRIAFAANDPSNPADGYFHYDLHVIDLETDVQTQLTEPLESAAEPNNRPAWSPDGQRIAFISWRAPDGPDLYVMPSTGGEPRRVTHFLRHRLDTPLAWSPDGQWIALSTDGDTYLVPTTGGDPIRFPSRSIVRWLPK